ncbi:MAG TPA: histidine kinase, partial [Chitinophagaceae bacterium]|nr:histidine kinase [Chitinophagaceae bacterium]
LNNAQSENALHSSGWGIWIKMEFAELFSLMHQFDSAWYYYHLFKPAKEEEVFNRIYLVSTGECYFLQKDFKSALQNFLEGLRLHRKLNDRNQVMRTLLDIASTYIEMGNDSAALKYGQEGLDIAINSKARQFTRDGYKILFTIYDHWRKEDSANYYFRQYSALNDSVANDQTKAKFATYTYEQRVMVLNKEKELKEEKLIQSNLQKKLLLFGVTALCLIGFVLVRNLILKRKNERLRLQHELELQRLESEKAKAELQQQAAELEMQALRAQMNPHFIFNSLNSINRFILQNNKAQASGYLTKFSRLVRLILQNSQESLIPLESELEALQLYLELEEVRFDHHFEFKIKVEDDLDVSAIKVPPLIIQPYAENAIWHGLMHKEETGHLEIELFKENDLLCYKINDDGIGRKKASELKSKSTSTHKSMGMQITADRIAILQQKKTADSYIKITDLVLPDGSAGGTEVLLKIPVNLP